MPIDIVDLKEIDEWIYPVNKDPNLAIMPKHPTRKLNEFDTHIDYMKDNMHYHFKIVRGMFVEG